VDVFRACAAITKITNCKLTSVGLIGDRAFAYCSNLKEVIFGTSTVTTLNTIGTNAFYSCTSLTKIDLGNIAEIADSIVINDNAFASVPAGGEIWATSKQVT
jgi:hypothetical protein